MHDHDHDHDHAPVHGRRPMPPASHAEESTEVSGAASGEPSDAASGEDGSLVSEYGLVAVLGATIAGLAIAWARGGAVATLLGAVLEQLRGVVVG